MDVHHERWDTPYRGVVELCGCGGGMPTFAATPAVDEAAIPDAAPVASWITPVVVDLNGDNTAATDSDRCACAALSNASLMKPALS